MQSGRLRPDVIQNRAAKAYRPTVSTVREKNTLQWMSRVAQLCNPIRAAISRVDCGALGAYGPAFKRVKKLNVIEIGSDA